MAITAKEASIRAREIAAMAPIIPVLVVEDASRAADLAAALVAGGLPALEVTLRTPAALEAIRAMAKVPGGIVGAGTLITKEDVIAAKEAGATFGVSPARRMRCWMRLRKPVCQCLRARRRPPRRWRFWRADMIS